VDKKQKIDNEIELGRILNEFYQETEKQERTMTGSRIADFVIALLAVIGAFTVAGLVGGSIKI